MATMPQWATAPRLAKLAELAETYGNYCLKGHHVMLCDDPTHYVIPKYRKGRKVGYTHRNLGEQKVEDAIASWVAEDRERRCYEWKLEQQLIHGTPTRGYNRRFDPVTRDGFMAEQPDFYLDALGLDPWTGKQVAMVRIPSSYVYLFVDVTRAVEKLSKNKRRKVRRYGATPPEGVEALCRLAVIDWWQRNS